MCFVIFFTGQFFYNYCFILEKTYYIIVKPLDRNNGENWKEGVNIESCQNLLDKVLFWSVLGVTLNGAKGLFLTALRHHT